MNHKTDMQAVLQACVDAMLHDGVPTDPEHPKRIALIAAEAALASRPDAQADERGAFEAWMRTGELDPVPNVERDGEFYEEFEVQRAWRGWQARAAAPKAEAAQGVADGWRLMPPSLTLSMRMAMGTAAAEYMKRTGGNSLDVIYEAGFAAAPDREHEVPCAKLVGRWDYGKPGCVRYEPDFPRGDIPEGTPVYVGSAPSPDREQVGDVPEGCTPADAEMLRKANHALAAENDRLRHCLRPFAQLANSRLSWAMVEYCVKDDPEKQTLQAPQMQRAFNRAAEALSDDASPSRECGERQRAAAVVREALEAAFEERDGWRVKVAAAVRTIGAASAPTLGEQQWPSDRDAAIQACALMILGICKTEPQEVWPKRIEGRIRYMLSKLQPQAAEPKGLTGFDVALNALDEYQHNWDTGLPSEYAQSERTQMECACDAVREALLAAKGE